MNSQKKHNYQNNLNLLNSFIYNIIALTFYNSEKNFQNILTAFIWGKEISNTFVINLNLAEIW